MICAISASQTIVLQPDSISLSCTIDGPAEGPLSYAWDFDGDGTTDSTAASPSITDIGVYTPTVIVTDANNASCTATLSGKLIVYSADGRVYVTAEANPNAKPPYATWATAATSVKAGMDYLLSGGTMVLGDGTHTISGASLDVRKDITITSANGPESTFVVRSGFSSYIFLLANADAVLEGFTIQNDSTRNFDKGAVIRIDAGTVRNCRFLRNVFSGQGLVAAYGSGSKIERCAFIGNYADYNQGPTVKISGDSARVSDCLFVCNTNKATGDGSTGGGVLIANASGQVRNCTFVGNVSYAPVPAGIHNSSGGYVRNCILFGNMDYAGGAYTNANGIGSTPAKVSHSLLYPEEGIPAGLAKVFSADPLFRDAETGDYTLKTSSPCINAGTNLTYTAASIDLAGNPRIHNFGKRSGIVDLGCYESAATRPTTLFVK